MFFSNNSYYLIILYIIGLAIIFNCYDGKRSSGNPPPLTKQIPDKSSEIDDDEKNKENKNKEEKK